MLKKELRKSLLEKRDSLEDISLSIVSDIINSKILDNLKKVAIYYPLKKEISVLELINHYPSIDFCFPKTKNEIEFFCEKDLSMFKEGKFHCFEPITTNFVCRDDIDAFIIPCVGITKDNGRIGYGKGYYDRYLDGYKGIKIGVIYKELNKIDFECDPWDLKLDYVFER